MVVALDPDIAEKMIGVRRTLHRRPELSNEEQETTALIRRELEAAGLADVRPAAGTGLYVDITGTAGPSNRKLAIRADIDALPIEEETGLPFSSERKGVMHACGHDAHTAMVLATALSLKRHPESFRGTVRLIFQPAEEAEPLGGRRIVAEGLLDDVDAAIGIHVDPYTDSGRIAVGAGSYSLAADGFDLTIIGVSSHAAKPHEGVDAIAAGAAIVGELQKLVARETDPFVPLIVSVTTFQAGGSYNIIAEKVTMRGTIRSGNDEVRKYAQARVREIAESVAAAHRATARLEIIHGEPPVVNDAEMVSVIGEAGAAAGGPDTVLAAPGWTAADDFGFYSQKVPSVYFRLGVRNPAKNAVYALHHPKFTVDEDAMSLGAATLIEAARRFLAAEA